MTLRRRGPRAPRSRSRSRSPAYRNRDVDQEDEDDVSADEADAPELAPAPLPPGLPPAHTIPEFRPLETPHYVDIPKPTAPPPDLEPFSNLELLSIENYANNLLSGGTDAAFRSHSRTLERESRNVEAGEKLLLQYQCEKLLEERSNLKPILIDVCRCGRQAYLL